MATKRVRERGQKLTRLGNIPMHRIRNYAGIRAHGIRKTKNGDYVIRFN